MNTDEAIQKVLDIAAAQIGYHEKQSEDGLDDPTSNSGSANFTKFARDMDALGNYYNGKKQGVAWCDIFVDWCFLQAFGDKGRKMLYQPLKSAGAGCKSSANYFKSAGAFYDIPDEGDQVFFVTNGEFTHTGLVEKVTSMRITTIEGNSSDSVQRHSYARDSSKIGGYGRPNWPDVAEEGNVLYEAQVTAVSGRTVNLRANPSDTATVLKTVPVGSSVDVLDDADPTWAKVRWAYYDGYMMRKFLVKETPTETYEALKEARDSLAHALAIIEGLMGGGVG